MLHHLLKITRYPLSLFLILFLMSCSGSSFAKSANLGMVFESTINLEVDGKPITLQKRFNCQIKQYSKAGGDRFAEVSQNNSVVSYELPTGEVLIAAMPYACNRFGADQRDSNGKIVSYKIVKPLPENFLPYIAIADKGPVPDKVIVYASNLAYKAKASRIVFKGISLGIAPKGSRVSKRDPFYWFLSRGGGKGPYYHSFVLRKAVMFPELRALLDEHASGFTEPVAFHDGRWKREYQWFIDFYAGTKPPHNINSRKMFPDYHWSNAEFGGNAANSVFDKNIMTFRLENGTDFSKDTFSVILDKDYRGMKLLYRMPYEYFWGYQPVYEKRNIIYVFGEKNEYVHHAGQSAVHILFNNVDKNIYRLSTNPHYTIPVKGSGMGKYNYKGKEY